MAAPSAEHRVVGLESIRKELLLTQQDVADLAEITRQTYAKIESGQAARSWTIYSIFDAIKATYGDRFSSLDLNKSGEDENLLILNFEIKHKTLDISLFVSDFKIKVYEILKILIEAEAAFDEDRLNFATSILEPLIKTHVRLNSKVSNRIDDG